jgi:hypothetical protein
MKKGYFIKREGSERERGRNMTESEDGRSEKSLIFVF